MLRQTCIVLAGMQAKATSGVCELRLRSGAERILVVFYSCTLLLHLSRFLRCKRRNHGVGRLQHYIRRQHYVAREKGRIQGVQWVFAASYLWHGKRNVHAIIDSCSISPNTDVLLVTKSSLICTFSPA